MNQQQKDTLAALKQEREGYKRRKLPDRVKEVDAAIRKVGDRETPEKSGPDTETPES